MSSDDGWALVNNARQAWRDVPLPPPAVTARGGCTAPVGRIRAAGSVQLNEREDLVLLGLFDDEEIAA
jgi:hypothetical protein